VQDGELMAQHEDLGIFGTLASASQHQQVDHKSDETVETGHVPILIDPSRADQIQTAKPQVNTPDEFSAPTGPRLPGEHEIDASTTVAHDTIIAQCNGAA
jgi:hypothetical protein